MPTETQLNNLYSNEYFFGKEYFDYIADRPALEKNFQNRIRRLSYTYHPEARIIEIGCAYGYFLNLIKNHVAVHQGFDINKGGVAFAQKNLGLNASNENFLDAKILRGSIDSIYMWDVIEHLPRPDLFLERARNILKNGGYLVLTTGDFGALLPRIRGCKWRMIHPPTHLHYFTKHSLAVLGKKYNLKIVSIRHKGIYRNFGSVLHQIIYNRKAKNKNVLLLEMILRIANKTKIYKLNISLNLGDIMEVVAVKTGPSEK